MLVAEDRAEGGEVRLRRRRRKAREAPKTPSPISLEEGGRSLFFLFLASRLPGKGGGGRSPSKQKGGSLGSRERGLLLRRRRAKTHGAKKKMRERET